MAAREWDQGKDRWGHEDDGYGHHGNWDDRNHVSRHGQGHGRREREDDYDYDYSRDADRDRNHEWERERERDDYREGKRQKYNDGGYRDEQTISNQKTYSDAAWGDANSNTNVLVDQQDADWSRDKPKKRLVPSEPSEHVIFLGLDTDFTEADLQTYLVGHGHTAESVTIIRDRNTGLSKGFGFAQFASAEQARKFVEPFFPFVSVPPPASHGASATAIFNEALESGAPHNGRRVKIDYSQSANPADRGKPRNSNDGTRDIGPQPSPVLLLRGLDPLSGPGAITQAMNAAQGPGKEGGKGMRRIVLIKDKVTLASWGFAFVEFVDVASASAVLAASMSAQIHPNGFRISDRPVAASFAQTYSFQPVDPMQRDEAALKATAVLGGDVGWVRYWDPASTVAVAEFEVQMSVNSTAQKEKEKEKERKKKKAAEKQPEASLLPISDKPVTLSFKGGLALNKSTAVKSGLSSAFGDAEEDEEQEEEEEDQNAVANAKVAAARKVGPMIASKKTAKNINKWNQVQEVLSQVVPAKALAAAQPRPQIPLTSQAQMSSTLAAAKSTAAPTVAEPAKVKAPTPPLDADMHFSDITGKICLLCARQFKTPEMTTRHAKESDLHKKNLQDVKLVEVARGKVLASGSASNSSTATSSTTGTTTAADAPKYRDRASERRVMHNQPDMPLPEASLGSLNGGGAATGLKGKTAQVPAAPALPPPPIHPGKDENNVGNKLLKMMGWKEGQGLGENGDGRADPIQTSIFAAGVGLGASKGVEIGKHPEGYAGYLSKGRDVARDRYERKE